MKEIKKEYCIVKYTCPLFSSGPEIQAIKTHGGFYKTPPGYGEDNTSFLKDAGYTKEEINNFIKM